MKTYLSIDLDYWNGLGRRSINAFFKHVFQLGLPIWVAPFHHQLLPHINQHDCDTLVNVDYHSDITDCLPHHRLPCNEGTWANFVEWKYHNVFVWRYPDPACLTPDTGYCHDLRNPFHDASVAGWEDCVKQEGLRAIPWDTIQGVGVSLSIAWIERWRNPLAPITKALGIEHWLMWDSIEQATLAQPFLRMVA